MAPLLWIAVPVVTFGLWLTSRRKRVRHKALPAPVDELEPPGPDIQGFSESEFVAACGDGLQAALKAGEFCLLDPLEDPRFAPLQRLATLAAPGQSPVWPVVTSHPNRWVTSSYTQDGKFRGIWGNHFGSARRVGDVRVNHVGVDLQARAGDLVIAPEDARVIAVLPFFGDTSAVYLRTNNGNIVVLGEVAKNSHKKFDVRVGDAVTQGQALAQIGKTPKGTSMLHVEIYYGGGIGDEAIVEMIREGKMQWPDKEPFPPRVLDPSAYLVDAGHRSYRREADHATS